MIINPDQYSNMPKLMTAKPSIKHPWPPFLRPSVCIYDDSRDISKERFYYRGIEEECIGDTSDDHEMENGDDAGCG
jgi:hypothetical protein